MADASDDTVFADGEAASDDGRDSGDGDTDGAATASALVRACEDAWADIQSHHPELPPAVIVLGTGVERGRLVKLGHWWGGRWLADGEVRGEVLLAGEALHLAPSEVFEVLLHEAAHGLNAARGIKDTSRGGRYHNQRFAATAREVLLTVKALPPYGLARTVLSDNASARYENTIARLSEAMRIVRQLERNVGIGIEEGQGGVGGRLDGAGRAGDDNRPRGPLTATCECGRRLRMAPGVFAAGPVLCGRCGAEFNAPAERRRSADTEAASGGRAADADVDMSFMQRRHAAIAAETTGAAGTPEPDVSGAPWPRVAPDHFARERALLDAVIAAAADPDHPNLVPLRERRDRLQRLTGGADPDRSVPPLSADQRQGIHELAVVEPRGTDVVHAAHWYERFGTPEEEPMLALTSGDEMRRVAIARGLLKADGTLTGPAVRIGDREFMAGDRVVAAGGHVPHLAAGVLGTVEGVDVGGGALDIDFGIWGRLRSSLSDAVAQTLRHDYVEQGSTQERAAAIRAIRDRQLEPDRIYPGAER